MIIKKWSCNSFRNFTNSQLELNSGLNVFIGDNGSGKSSIVESIYLFGFGRSFRTNKLLSCIQHSQDNFAVFLEAQESGEDRDNQTGFNAGLSKSIHSELVCHINGDRNTRLNDLVKRFPVQLFTPQSTDLIIGSPKDRRKFLDWGVFHVEHAFERISREFRNVLRQRNALLKADNINSGLLQTWNLRFIALGNSITELREAYISEFEKHFTVIQQQFLTGLTVNLEYNKGWKKDLSLAEAIQQREEKDRLFKVSTIGPHKADLKFLIDGKDASETLSRGQLRMLVAALLLAQTKTYNRKMSMQTIFLLDDIGAELDEGKRSLFLSELIKMGSQIFVTSIDEQQIEFLTKYDNKKMFHVKHGSVKEE